MNILIPIIMVLFKICKREKNQPVLAAANRGKTKNAVHVQLANKNNQPVPIKTTIKSTCAAKRQNKSTKMTITWLPHINNKHVQPTGNQKEQSMAGKQHTTTTSQSALEIQHAK